MPPLIKSDIVIPLALLLFGGVSKPCRKVIRFIMLSGLE